MEPSSSRGSNLRLTREELNQALEAFSEYVNETGVAHDPRRTLLLRHIATALQVLLTHEEHVAQCADMFYN